jgi:hypothetical protein
MIGLAVLEYVASKVDGLVVGQNCFYEDLPIDFETGQMSQYGVFVTTEPAPMSRTSDRQQFLTFYVAIGEGALDEDGVAIAEKYETDRILDAIQTAIIYSDDDAQELCSLTVTDTDLIYKDVRLEGASSKERGVTLPNGAIVKSIVAKVIYKN